MSTSDIFSRYIECISLRMLEIGIIQYMASVKEGGVVCYAEVEPEKTPSPARENKKHRNEVNSKICQYKIEGDRDDGENDQLARVRDCEDAANENRKYRRCKIQEREPGNLVMGVRESIIGDETW